LTRELLLAAETYLWGLQCICRLHRVPFAANLVAQQFPPPYDLLSLQQAATALGLKSGLRNTAVAELPELPTPFIAALEPAGLASTMPQGAGLEGKVHRPFRLAIVTKCEGGNISYFEEGRQHPAVSTLDSFGAQFAGKVLLCVPAAPRTEG